jgi:hypothetical protein
VAASCSAAIRRIVAAAVITFFIKKAKTHYLPDSQPVIVNTK